MKIATEESLIAAAAASAALQERVVRLGEEQAAALAAVEVASAAMTKSLVDGKVPDEKRYELALEERDRASRRLAAAMEALDRAKAIEAQARREDEAGRAAASLDAETVVAKEVRRDLRRAAIDFGRALRAMADCDARSWAARRTLQALGGDGPIESFAIPSLALTALLDEVAGELSSKRDGRTCERLTVPLPY